MKIAHDIFHDFHQYELTKSVLSEFSERSDSVLVFDIETTGLSAKGSITYLIGCAYFKGDVLHSYQFFAENISEEAVIIEEFLSFANGFSGLVTFNGEGFDLPYLKERCRALDLPHHLDSFASHDLYKMLLPFKKILGLPNLKQKTLELFLGLSREDSYSGRELISIYQQYCMSASEETLPILLLHNLEDLLGLVRLIPMLSYVHFFNGGFEVLSQATSCYQDHEGAKGKEWILTLQPRHSLPKRLSYRKGDTYLMCVERKVKMRIKIHQGELKHFYSNYKDYYYLPEEDLAIHKSVASFVDKNFRTKARASTCYSKKSACFLPQFGDLFLPSMKTEYRDPTSYFEMTEGFLHSSDMQKRYALHVLQYYLR